MNFNKMFLAASLLFSGFASSSFGQTCQDARLNRAFSLGLSRQPAAAECNANRFAGGVWKDESELVALVKASIVCSDPWIAQAYYVLGLKLNNQDPWLIQNGQPGSTRDQCNYSEYGSWSNFEQLKQLVRQKRTGGSPAPPPPPAATALVTITGPGTMKVLENVTVTWRANGAVPTCGSGFRLQVSGGVFGTAYGMGRIPDLQQGSFTFQFPEMSRNVTSDFPITMNLFDPCKSMAASNVFASRVVLPAALPTVTLSTGQQIQLNPAPTGKLLTTEGNLMNANGQVVVDPNRHYYIAGGVIQFANLVAAGGGNLVAAGGGNLVAAGGGNLVAAGGGNLVAAGGGNLVAAGGGNVVAMPQPNFSAKAPDRELRGWNSAGYMVDSYGIRVLQLGTGVVARNRIMVDYTGAAIALNSGSNMVFDATGAMRIIAIDPARMQQVLAGTLNVNAILNPGNVTPGIIAIDPSTMLNLNNLGNVYNLQSMPSYSVSGFSAGNGTWANRSPIGFSWSYKDTPGSATVTVRMQLAGRIYDVCKGIAVTASGCQVGAVDWSRAINVGTAAALVLVDTASGKTVATANITIQVP